ncbi:MAG: alkaline phosphatase family protein [Clostridia bacterium]|nr:alkaline phosphatase family protein [Clostridia bacterium]
MKKRILVFSVDAMISEDIDYLRTKPNFKKYLAGGSEVRTIRTVYPSVTYPSHVSMMSGCYPDRHGISSNFAFTTDSKEDTWLWFADNIKCGDIFTASKAAGYSTAAVFWTVTGNHPCIDYNITEYWMPQKDDTLRSSFARAGANEACLEIIEKNAHLLADSYKLTGRKNFMIHPEVDNFLITNCCDIIREYSPEVVFVHNGNMDNARHKNGAMAECLKGELDLVDGWIGQLGEALEAAGVLQDTDFFLVSDHGQRDIKRTIKPNVYLADHGFIELNEKSRPTSWKAYCLSNAMSSMVFLKDPNDKETYDAVYKLLCDMCEEGIYGFSKVFRREELEESEHLSGDFSFVLESDGYTSFSDSCKRPVIQPIDLTDFRFGAATHGYLPDLGPQPTLVAKGPHIKEGVVLDRRPIVDEAPTYAKILGVELPDAQGTAIDEILK